MCILQKRASNNDIHAALNIIELVIITYCYKMKLGRLCPTLVPRNSTRKIMEYILHGKRSRGVKIVGSDQADMPKSGQDAHF